MIVSEEEKFFIILSPVAEDKEGNSISYYLQTVETLQCSCIKLIEKLSDLGSYFVINIDMRRLSANDTGKHDIVVIIRDD